MFAFPDFFNLTGDTLPSEDATLRQNPRQEGSALIAAALLMRLEEVAAINSDDKADNEAGNEDLENDGNGQGSSETGSDAAPQNDMDFDSVYNGESRKRARTTDLQKTSMQWYPWSDRIRQLDLFLWLLRVNGVPDVPSVKTMKTLNEAIQKMCGIDTLCYDGALGNRYYVNSLAQMIAQEMSNPQVHPKLHFYPEDSSPHLSQARQAQCWLHEAPNELLTPIYADEWYMLYPLITSESELAATQFLKNFEELKTNSEPLYKLPHPSHLLEVLSADRQTKNAWSFTDPVEGNHWRKLADGHRVVSFPIWMHCDDTSGNVSKKWNKHNSFLFTAAGLPRHESSKEYNVHFLSTSNIAPPLKMLDSVIDQLKAAQEHGIWAWNCKTKEPILVLPWVLALLGDNPMQSEFAGHIGLCGKYFCRVCWVKDPEPGNTDDDDHQTTNTNQSQSSASEDTSSSESPPKRQSKKKKTKFVETFAQMVEHVSSFIRAALEHEIQNLPAEVTSPVWHIKGLDPHHDTPVEILHVVLLGFLKYMWWDLVNQVKNQDKLKKLLEIRLMSLDYSGSLTGRDFRVIAQIAPFVIHDLNIGDSCREAWLALSQLVPLIWQPEIDNIDEYMETLEHEINNFLLCVARWTSRWFNKPKFHIIIHLALHIQRFGPAMLFATEAFESFNAVIRAKTPSCDIALTFAQGNRIRHLLSHTMGSGPASLVSSANTMTHYLGLDSKKPQKPAGLVSLKDTGPLPFGSTLTGSVMPLYNIYPEHVRQFSHFLKCSQVVMADGSACSVGSFFIGRNSSGSKYVEGSSAAFSRQAGSILVHVIDTSSEAPQYRMQKIVFTNRYILVNSTVCFVF
ncbi:hypothetical protein GGU10DRAFT_427831 [Lentinula aff. detonsa]|uniref:Uncharacterized protein n=1 Tax=Lentinula aff. detonsa TaxID=2804958 RepID=A0AA38NJG9_9AGAR|nr:hypothetical protein GGU10DRAFT_427831 [Lentinula aff. detonsa]